MKRLYAKIFLWFWITGTITGIASVLVVVFEHHPMRQTSSRVFQDTANFFGVGAVDVLEESGPKAASDYIMELSKNTRIRGCIFDERASPLAGEQCQEFQDLATQIAQGGHPASVVSHNSTKTAMKIPGSDGHTFIFAPG